MTIKKDGVDYKKVLREKYKLMGKKADKGERPRYGLKDVLYKEDAKEQFNRDKKVGKVLKKAINQPQDKKGKIKGKSVLDVVKTVNTVKEGNKWFNKQHGDYDKVATKNVRKYHNNSYKEGK